MSALSIDQRLRTRMIVALGLIVLLPFAFVYTFLFLANTIGIGLLEGLSDRPYHGEFYVSPILLSIVVIGGLVLQYRYGPRAAIGSVDASPVTSEEYPALHATLTRLSAQLDLTTPSLAVVDTEVPNSFAVTGGSLRGLRSDDPGKTSAVVVTTGLLELLEDDELEAVLAHELAHVKNRDANLMTVAWLLPTVTYYVATVAFTVLYGMYQVFLSGLIPSSGSNGSAAGAVAISGSAQGDGDGDGAGLVAVIVVILVCTVISLAVSTMFWLASVLLYRILSRHREYTADHAAAAITGSPATLASALEKLDERMPELPDEDLRKLDGGTEALYLAPLESRAFTSKELISTDIFPDTHPPTSERINRLRELAAETRSGRGSNGR